MQHGVVVFSDGEMHKTFEIEIADNDVWNMEAIQLVVLHSPVNCILGELKSTTIVILNEVSLLAC